MKKFCYIVLALALALLCTACYEVEPGISSELLASEDFSLEIQGTQMFKRSFKESECQLGFNEAKKQFRVGDDQMKDYYVLECDKVPSVVNETLLVTLIWTINETVQKRTNLPMKVSKIGTDGRIWLWSSKDQIAAIVYKP